MLCWGVYRFRDSQSSDQKTHAPSNKRYVICNPSADFQLIPTDKIYVLEQFDPNRPRFSQRKISSNFISNDHDKSSDSDDINYTKSNAGTATTRLPKNLTRRSNSSKTSPNNQSKDTKKKYTQKENTDLGNFDLCNETPMIGHISNEMVDEHIPRISITKPVDFEDYTALQNDSRNPNFSSNNNKNFRERKYINLSPSFPVNSNVNESTF